MARIKLEKGQQKEFLNRIAEYLDFDWPKIAKISNVCERTLRDWRSEKYNMNYEAFLQLRSISSIPAPKIIEVLPEYWSTNKSSRLGAIRRNELYGNPGTPEGRSRGGLTTIRKFHEDPRFAKEIGFKLRTSIAIPSYSSGLAEFVGLLLGDGHIKNNKTQVGISFNRDIDYGHAKYIQSLVKDLFRLGSSICDSGKDKGATVVISSRNLVDYLISVGLKPGNKVANQVGIPEWIWLNKEFKVSCLRGLMDTDGSFYSYNHRVNGRFYTNYALDFTNHSLPLLRGVEKILKDLGCFPTLAKFKILLHKKNDIRRYISIVGTNNPRIRNKFETCLARYFDLGRMAEWSKAIASKAIRQQCLAGSNPAPSGN